MVQASRSFSVSSSLMRSVAVSLGFVLACGTAVRGETVYSNIATSADVDGSLTARPVGFSNVSNPNLMYAQGFTSGTANLDVQSILVGLGADTPVSSAQVRLFSNTIVSGSNLPDAPIATFTGTTAVENTAAYLFTGSFTLQPSTPYWVVVSDAAAGSESSFSYYDVESDAQPTGTSGYSYLATRRSSDGGGTWLNFAAGDALSVSITAVPEPGAYALAGIGLVTAGLMRWRRRRAGG